MTLRPLALNSLLALLAAACGSSSTQAGDGLSGRLTLTGSSTVAPLAAEIAKRFEREHPGVRVDVQTGGSSRGIADAKRGTADIGMASRALKASEGDELTAYPIAHDGVALILHADNPVTSLPDHQVRAIYTGVVTNWSEVGGADAPITVVNKASGRATLEVFLKHFRLAEEDVDADVVIGDNPQGIKTVSMNRDAIGYVSIGAAEYEVGAGTPIRVLPAGGVAATTENVGAGLFPIGRPLNLVTLGPAEGLAKEFIEYCRSDAVHDLVRDLYFVPVATQ